jgi:hypothetical protein
MRALSQTWLLSRSPVSYTTFWQLAQARIRIGDDERLVGVAFHPAHGLLPAATA